MSRSIILERIRRACLAGGRPELADSRPPLLSWREPVERFRQELEAVGGVFLDGRGQGNLEQSLHMVLEETGVSQIYWESQEVLDQHGLPYRLRQPQAFVEGALVYSVHHGQQVQFPLLLNGKPYRRNELEQVSLCASRACMGVAESGTILHQVSSNKGRLFSLLPPAQLVFLSEKDLVQNLDELFVSLSARPTGATRTLITGPSRTADIEKTLVVGVHGPKRLFLILTG